MSLNPPFAEGTPIELPTVEIGEYRLRPLRPGDHVAWSAYLSRPEVTRHTSWGDTSPGAIEQLVAACLAACAAGTACRWAIADARDQLIGTVGFPSWSLAHGHAEIAYDLAPRFWGLGVASRAVAAAVDWAFAVARLNRVHAFVLDTNLPSRALLERGGFAREGLLRQFRIVRGIPRDFFLYAALRDTLRGGAGRSLTTRCS